MAGKTWVLDTETKGTGASMVPLEKVQKQPERPAARPSRAHAPRDPAGATKPPEHARAQARQVERSATELPPGHVRKRSTGEIGKVQAVDPRAGTATVRWLKRGSVSTVPLSAVSRR
jgi:hypothetical protein